MIAGVWRSYSLLFEQTINHKAHFTGKKSTNATLSLSFSYSHMIKEWLEYIPEVGK